MSNRHALSLLEAYVDNELSDEDYHEVEEHLKICPECKAEHDELVRLKELLKSTPLADPGESYWTETTDLILARTVDHDRPEMSRMSVERSRADSRRAFVRSLASAAVALFVLFSAISIGSLHQQEAGYLERTDNPILVTAPLKDLLDSSVPSMFTPQDRIRLAQGMMLIGPPGFMGKFTGLAELDWSGQP